MTAKNSVNLSGTGNYLLYKLKKLSPKIILVSIFSLLIYVLTAIVNSNYLSAYDAKAPFRTDYGMYVVDEVIRENYFFWNSMKTISDTIMVISLICLAIVVFTIILSNFRYLHKKIYVDMAYSLPISEESRFAGDFLSGLAAIAVPQLVSIGISAIIYGISGYLDEISFVYNFLFALLLSFIMFYCLNLLIITLCGRTREVWLMAISINIALPILIATLISGIYENAYGCLYYNINYLDAISATPFGLIFTIFLGSNSFAWHLTPVGNFYELISAKQFIVAIIMTIIFIAAAFMIYRVRRTERVGSPFVFKHCKVIFMSIVTFTLTALFGVCFFDEYLYQKAYNNPAVNPNLNSNSYSYHPLDQYGYLIYLVLTTLAAYIVLECLCGNKFKKFHHTMLRYAVTVAAGFGIVAMLVFSGGLGAEGYVPAAEDVKSLHISGYGDISYDFTVKKTDQIEQILLYHKQAIADKPDGYVGAGDSFSNSYFKVDYTLKNGENVIRRYPISDKAFEDLKKMQFDFGAYADKFILNDLDYTGDVVLVMEKYTDTEGNKNTIEYSHEYAQVDIGLLQAALLADAAEADYESVYGDARVSDDGEVYDTNSFDLMLKYADETTRRYGFDSNRMPDFPMSAIPMSFVRTLQLIEDNLVDNPYEIEDTIAY